MGQSNRLRWLMIAAMAFVTATPALAIADEAELRERFGEQQFAPTGGFVLRQGQKLPDLVWNNPELVATLVGNPAIPTRWFNEQFEEVAKAAETGRYYAYGEAPVPNGPALRRAMTCCCVGKDVNLKAVAEKSIAGTPEAQYPDGRREEVDDLVRQWQSTEEGAVELAALLDADRPAGPVRRGQWQMENATQHVLLKRKLMGLDRQPLVKATPKQLPGEAAPTLREAPLTETGISEAHVRAIESKLDDWYAASKEPMAIVIAQNGVIVLAKGFGTLDGEQVTVDTPMSLDSAMKPLIGLQLATYIDRGYLQLDEPIGNYLPDFDTPRDRNLTFRSGHVHATGIHFPWELAFRRLFYFHTWHESLIAHCKREWEPGAKHRYGVVGVILSVRALELLRGRNYWDAMERDLFAPLGIHNVLPGGRGFSAESMARIGVLLDNGGKYGAWEVFSEKTHAAILPTSLKPYFPDLDMEYGIGLKDASQHLGPGSYGHGGGCGTLLAINPEQHLVVAMVRNGQGKDYKKYRDETMALVRKSIKE
ncbi:serine hydrolase domain-containing protein [Lignipirellula cremea]|uniref:Beta-lactamase n=1 Tax=Lignipirellula cremea TaxID=2528010 RepID=A0A518E400_9BACT|nr:serine hydrolase domain-containing protein [Lignipirellula cremea]QDU98808.1 Beta-lactamase [Lignipirellula cremea]